MDITAASEVWSHDDPGMHPSSEEEDLSDLEETVSDPEARGSGDALHNAGRRWGSESSPSAGDNSTVGDMKNNNPHRPTRDDVSDMDGDIDRNANAN